MNTNSLSAIEAKNKFSKFSNKDYRPGQEAVINRICQSEKKVVVISAPTGTGKSLIGMAVGAAHGQFAYLASSKQLQRQLKEDFPEAQLMMGRSNFACRQDMRHRSCALCIHSRETPCELRGDCLYQIHKQGVLEHPYQILNYHYFLCEANYLDEFTGHPIIIADEADVLEDILTGFIELHITQAQLDGLALSPPQYKTSTAKNGLANWTAWAEEEALHKVNIKIGELYELISDLEPDMCLGYDELAAVREYKALQMLHSKLVNFTKQVDSTWIFDERVDSRGSTISWTFKPTWLTFSLANENFWRHAGRFVLMSATFPPVAVLAETLGLGTGDIEYIELPSTFSVKNRPVILNPVANMGYKTFADDLPNLLLRVREILFKHPKAKGMIHTVSWRLNAEIMALSDPRLITHSSVTKDQKLEEFMKTENGVFVSPSCMRGVDLPGDLCRFVIIAKAPFQSLGDKLVSARVHGSGLGKYWYRALCAQEIVQASGRGVRRHDDYCVTYILDQQVERLVVDNQALFPRYWMESVDYM